MHKDDLVAEVLDEGDQIDTINRWYQSNLQSVPPKELYRKDLHQNDLFQKSIVLIEMKYFQGRGP